MDAVENKVLARIKKILAIANDAAASDAERDTAMTMANNLLAKYNLSMQDLPADQNNEPREKQEVIISADKWARNLASDVARMFFCKYYFMRGTSAGRDHHVFVGRQSNVVTAMYMAEYLIKSVKKEATKRYKSPTSPEGRSFCVGTVHTIGRRINVLLAADTTDDAGVPQPGTALALTNLRTAEKEANALWLANAGVELAKGKPRADNSLRAGAFYDGKDFGKSVSLNTQVGTSASTKRTALK